MGDLDEPTLEDAEAIIERPDPEAPVDELVEEHVDVTVEETIEQDPESEADIAVGDLEVVANALAAFTKRQPDAVGPSHLRRVHVAQRVLEETLTRMGAEGSVGGDVTLQFETRQRLVGDLLGGELTLEMARRLKEDAALGHDLFEGLVKEVVAARVGVQGEAFDAQAYADMLRGTRNVDTVRRELRSWGDEKRKRFSAGRQVVPPQPRLEPAPSNAPTIGSLLGARPEERREAPNLLSPRR